MDGIIKPGTLFEPDKGSNPEDTDPTPADDTTRIAESAGNRAVEVENAQRRRARDGAQADLGGATVPSPTTEHPPKSLRGEGSQPRDASGGESSSSITANEASTIWQDSTVREIGAAGVAQANESLADAETAEEKAHRQAITRSPIIKREAAVEDESKDLSDMPTPGAIRRGSIPADQVHAARQEAEQ